MAAKGSRRRNLALASVAVLLVAVATFLMVRARSRDRGSVEIIPVITLPGAVFAPSLSPDGKEIAFGYREDDTKGSDICIQRTDDQKVVRLTSPPGFSSNPSWSPDGQEIAYSHWEPDESGKPQRSIMVMNRLGGNRHVVRKVFGGHGHVSWSPDGKTLAYSDIPPGESSGIFAMSADGSNSRRLTTAPKWDAQPEVSPDGRLVVFVRSHNLLAADLYIVPMAGGDARRLTNLEVWIETPVWTPGGDAIAFMADIKQGFSESLYSVSLHGGSPERLDWAGTEAGFPSYSSRGDQVTFVRTTPMNISIWSLRADRESQPVKVIASTRTDLNPSYSPDGSRVAFASTRDGTLGLWTSTPAGQDPIRLTALYVGGSPSWSPDGSRIAFDDRAKGHSQIQVIGSSGGAVTTIAASQFEDQNPAWAPDGDSLFFSSDRSGRYEIWRILLTSGSLTQITKGGGVLPELSRDGRFVYYNKPAAEYPYFPTHGVWRISVSGGSEELIQKDATWQWRVTVNDLYFVDPSGPQDTLKRLSLDTRQVHPLRVVEAVPNTRSFDVSPDGTTILYGQFIPPKSDVLLATGRITPR